MKDLTLEIKPLEGFGELEFGMTPDEVFEYLGQPDEEEVLEDDEMGDTKVLSYWNKSVSAFFDDPEDPVLTNLETDNPDAMLFGKRIFAMKEKEIIKLMNDNGFSEMEVEDLEDEEYENERRVSFDEAQMDFFFEDEILTVISWGADFEYEDDEE